MKTLTILGALILSGCVGGGSTTALKGPEVNDGTPGTYHGYNYVPKVYTPRVYGPSKGKHD